MSYNESLNSNSNYPNMSQSEWDNAPWNQEDPEPQEIEVTVSITLSKTVKIKVDDYTAEEEVDEDGEHYVNYDFSECDLKRAVQEQMCLPNEAYDKLINAVLSTENYEAHEAIKDLKGWYTDDFEVILE